MIVNRRKRRAAPLLFPGWELQQRVGTYHRLATLTGEIFEALTDNTMQGVRRTTNGAADLCPDLLDERERVMVESKASNVRSQHKVHRYQIDQYAKARAQGWRVWYALWSYGARNLRTQYQTMGRVVEAVTQSVQYCDVLDLAVIEALYTAASARRIPGARWLRNWSEAEARDQRCDNPLLLISQTFLRRLRATPDVVLFEELGLHQDAFEYSAQGHVRAACTYDGVHFKTNGFVSWQITHVEEAPF